MTEAPYQNQKPSIEQPKHIVTKFTTIEIETTVAHHVTAVKHCILDYLHVKVWHAKYSRSLSHLYEPWICKPNKTITTKTYTLHRTYCILVGR